MRVCHGCTHCERNHTLVQPVERIKKHLLVAVLIDDSRKGIEHQMDPSSFTSCQIISCLTAQPFVFSLVATPHVLPVFCCKCLLVLPYYIIRIRKKHSSLPFKKALRNRAMRCYGHIVGIIIKKQEEVDRIGSDLPL